MAAPSAAPDAVPSTYGSASGLRRSPWKVAPATARPAPTTSAVRTRGRRSSRTIVSAAGAQVRSTGRPERAEEDPDRVAGRDGHAPGGDAEDDDRRQDHEAGDGEGGRARRSGGPSETGPGEGERAAADRHGRF